MTLYELTAQFQQLADALVRAAEDPELETAIAAMLEDTAGNLEEKAEGYARVIRNFEAEAKMYREEEKRLAEKRKVCENSIERLKNNLQAAMAQTGMRKFSSGVFSFAIVKNGGKAPIVEIPPAEELPEELTRVTIEPDKDAIRKYIEETGDLSYGSIGERGESLRIR